MNKSVYMINVKDQENKVTMDLLDKFTLEYT